MFFCLLSSFSCKKNPVIPNAEELSRPVIWLNAFEFSFTAYQSAGDPAAQVFQVKNIGKDTLQYSISDDADWISVEPPSGSSTGQLVEHTILVNKGGLAARDAAYEATIMIASSEAFNNPQRISVRLKISSQPPPEIWVRPREMAFAALVGDSPPAQTLKVKNTGMGILTYGINWNVPWITVSPAGGSSGGAEEIHTVAVDSVNLSKGSYEGTITISSADATNSPQSVRISLEIGDSPPTPPPSTDNAIFITCDPSSGGSGTLVSIPVSIRGNLRDIETFGLELTFDSNLFQYQSTSTGNLTGGWMVDSGGSGSILTVGGLKGSANAIPVGSIGTIAVVILRVTGTGYSNGYQSQITIRGYIEDIQGMQPDPCSTSFTYRQ